MTTLTTEPARGASAAPGTEPGGWHAIHVYYGAVRHPMIADCVKPLIDDLRGDGLLAGYFFINYWVEGPHLRLRLKPVTAAATEEVLGRARAAIAGFLRVRPALYEAKSGVFAAFYNSQFDLEFSQEERARYLGPDGKMLIRDNNTFSSEPYEPEYDKYGGEAGVALAEWHFEQSSDLVVDIVRSMNVHLRATLLGISAQLMMVMASTFLPEVDATTVFLQTYHEFWNGAYTSTAITSAEDYDRAYQAMSVGVLERFSTIRTALTHGSADRLPGLLRRWAEHCTELRARVAELAESGQLVFQAWDGSGEERTTDLARAVQHLLLPYMHMTNNRLGMTLTDEAYLAYTLARALREAES